MNLKSTIHPTLLAVRSIGAEFARRVYRIVALLVLVISAASMGLTAWLTTFSQWWWLLFALLVIAVSVAFGVLFVVWRVIKSVTPYQSREQRKLVKAFVDKLQRLSETTQTSKFTLLFQIVRDIAAPRENGFIASLSNDTTSLKRDFTALSSTFR